MRIYAEPLVRDRFLKLKRQLHKFFATVLQPFPAREILISVHSLILLVRAVGRLLCGKTSQVKGRILRRRSSMRAHASMNTEAATTLSATGTFALRILPISKSIDSRTKGSRSSSARIVLTRECAMQSL